MGTGNGGGSVVTLLEAPSFLTALVQGANEAVARGEVDPVLVGEKLELVMRGHLPLELTPMGECVKKVTLGGTGGDVQSAIGTHLGTLVEDAASRFLQRYL